MKVVSVVGARPQFIKAAPMSAALRERGHTELLLHTGQHYDYGMSQLFFEQTGLRPADVDLNVGSGSHGKQTAAMLSGIEQVLQEQRPDWVVVFGDTNSTLAASLAASKLCLPLAHIEAGLRSFNRRMPEEINRVVADHVADLLFCPSQTAVANLRREGIVRGVADVGDVMYDAILNFLPRAQSHAAAGVRAHIAAGPFILATVHRAENTDSPQRLAAVLACLAAASTRVIFPVHPRTARRLADGAVRLPANVTPIEPVGYLEMLLLLKQADAVLTDSGGLQKEAYWVGVPCVTLREETEWVETVSTRWNTLAGLDPSKVRTALAETRGLGDRPTLYGDGHAAEKIVRVLEESLRADRVPASP